MVAQVRDSARPLINDVSEMKLCAFSFGASLSLTRRVAEPSLRSWAASYRQGISR